MSRISHCLLGSALLVGIVSANEPSYFRRDGGVVRSKAPLPDDFGVEAKRIWRTELAPGISTPCVYGEKIFVTIWNEEEKELATVALDRSTGRRLWTRVSPINEIERFHAVGSPASCTPACNGKQLFVFFGSFGLLCYDLDGKLLWDRPMGPFQDEFGASSSPVLVDGLVILNEDHDVDSFLVAIDQETGKEVWKTPRDGFTRSYSTPVIWDQGGSKQVVVAGSLQLAGYEVVTGKKRWWVDGLSRIVDPTPNITNGMVYIATWTPGGDRTNRISMEPFPDALAQFDANADGLIEETELPKDSPVVPRFFRIDLDQDQKLNKPEWDRHVAVFERSQNVAMAVRPGGRGDVTEKNVAWRFRRGIPTVPSSVVYDGILYMVKDSGICTSLDAASGKLLKQGRLPGRGNYYASLVAGDGKVYAASERGVVTALKAGRKWKVLSSHEFDERILATPVAVDGNIYIRTDDAIYRFGNRLAAGSNATSD